MTKARSPRPVESFGPEIFQALIEGAKRKLELQLPYSKAVFFRMRANQLRNQMRLNGHPQYATASQTRITITWPEGTPIRKTAKGVRIPLDPETPVTLCIRPSDSEFAEALAKVGVTVPALGDGGLTTQPSEGDPLDDVLANFLKEK